MKNNVVNIDWFKQELKKNNLNQSNLGNTLGLSRQVVSTVLKGERYFRADEIAKIANLLNSPALFVLAASTPEINIDKEINNEADTVLFAVQKSDEIIKKSGKVFDDERRAQLISLIYKIARKHQMRGQDMDENSIKLILSTL